MIHAKIDDGDEEAVDDTPPGDIVPYFVADIHSLELRKEKKHVSIYRADEDEYHDSARIDTAMLWKQSIAITERNVRL